MSHHFNIIQSLLLDNLALEGWVHKCSGYGSKAEDEVGCNDIGSNSAH
jgi:hypothetical protein